MRRNTLLLQILIIGVLMIVGRNVKMDTTLHTLQLKHSSSSVKSDINHNALDICKDICSTLIAPVINGLASNCLKFHTSEPIVTNMIVIVVIVPVVKVVTPVTHGSNSKQGSSCIIISSFNFLFPKVKINKNAFK